MTDNHPITPPPELVARWEVHWFDAKIKHINLEDYILAQAAQWGADQELEACCDWLGVQETRSPQWFDLRHDACALVSDLRAGRRPKPLSLKEQVSKALDRVPGPGADSTYLRQWSRAEAASLINDVRQVLEALPND